MALLLLENVTKNQAALRELEKGPLGFACRLDLSPELSIKQAKRQRPHIAQLGKEILILFCFLLGVHLGVLSS